MKDVKEPVIKRDTSFSVILLRNDCSVVRFRLNSFLVKSLLLFFLLFSAASGTAGYAAHYYWKKYTNLQRERSELTAKLGENRRQLGRFAGIEIIQETQPRSSMSGVTVAASDKTTPHAVQQTPPAQSLGDVAQSATPAAAPHSPTVVETPPSTPGPAQDAAVVASAPETTGQGGQEEDLKPNTANVDEVMLRPSGSQRIQLSFDLSNKDSRVSLNGRASLAVSTKNGEKYEITDVSRSSLRFLISRFKRVNTTFSLPDGVSADNVETVHITINAANMVPATFSFPMDNG